MEERTKRTKVREPATNTYQQSTWLMAEKKRECEAQGTAPPSSPAGPGQCAPVSCKGWRNRVSASKPPYDSDIVPSPAAYKTSCSGGTADSSSPQEGKFLEGQRTYLTLSIFPLRLYAFHIPSAWHLLHSQDMSLHFPLSSKNVQMYMLLFFFYYKAVYTQLTIYRLYNCL